MSSLSLKSLPSRRDSTPGNVQADFSGSNKKAEKVQEGGWSPDSFQSSGAASACGLVNIGHLHLPRHGGDRGQSPYRQDPRLIRGLREQSSPGDILFASMGFGSLPAPDPGGLYPRTSESGVAGGVDGFWTYSPPSHSGTYFQGSYPSSLDQQDGRKKEVLTVWVGSLLPRRGYLAEGTATLSRGQMS